MNEQQDVLHPENAKIITLARSARARVGTSGGAAVRDTDGRTYAAATVALRSMNLSALQVAVAMAASSGARDLEAAAVVTTDRPEDVDIAAVADLGGAGVPVYITGSDAIPVATLRS